MPRSSQIAVGTYYQLHLATSRLGVDRDQSHHVIAFTTLPALALVIEIIVRCL